MANRSEPVFYVRVKPKKHSTTGAATPAVQAALAKIASVKKVIQTILDKGPPTPTDSASLEIANDQLVKYQGQLAAAQAAAAKTPAQPAAPQDDVPDLNSAILSFEYVESEKKTDQCKLTIENNDLRWFDSVYFDKGVELVVVWGYLGHLVPARTVVVQKITGARQLVIEAAGKGQLMNKEAKTRTFNNVTRAEVVRKIAQEYGYGPEAQFIDDGPPSNVVPATVSTLLVQIAAVKKAIADALAPGPPTAGVAKSVGASQAQLAELETKLAAAKADAAKSTKSTGNVVRYSTIAQAAQTDGQLVKRLADLQGFEFFIDFDGFHWHPRRFAQRPLRELWYYLPPQVGDIIDFKIDNDVMAKPGAIVVKGTDPLNKTEINAKADNASTPRPVLAPETEVTDTVEVVDPVTGETSFKTATPSTDVKTTAEPSAAAASTEATGLYTRTQQTAVQMDLTLIADPGIVCKSVVLLKGFGKRLTGRYYIHELTHKIDSSGYKQTAKVRTDGTNAHGAVVPPSAGQKNTQTPAPSSDQGALTPKEVVDPVTGETHTVYVNTGGKEG